jgi:hypothetical protein
MTNAGACTAHPVQVLRSRRYDDAEVLGRPTSLHGDERLTAGTELDAVARGTIGAHQVRAGRNPVAPRECPGIASLASGCASS